MTRLTDASFEYHRLRVRCLKPTQETVDKRRASNGQGEAPVVEDRGWHEAVIRKLLAAGATVDAVTKEGFTPLHWCIQDSSRLPLALVLVGGGADPLHRATGGGGDRPLDRATLPSHKISLLRAAAALAQEGLGRLERSDAQRVDREQSLSAERGLSVGWFSTPPASAQQPPPEAVQEEGEEEGASPGSAGLDAAGALDAPATPQQQAAAAAAAFEPGGEALALAAAIAAARDHLRDLREELAALEGCLPRSAASDTDVPSPRFSASKAPSNGMRKARYALRPIAHATPARLLFLSLRIFSLTPGPQKARQ